MPAEVGAAPIRGIRASFVFLTRIPVGGFPFSAEDYRWAAAHAPLVGLVVGAIAAGVFRLLHPLGALAAAAFGVGASLLVTGAFHEDGLADTADALGGGYTPERVLEILKDSRIGSFGAAALGVSLIGRTALVARLDANALWALPLAFAAARVPPIWLMAFLPYVTRDAKAKSRDVSRGGKSQALVATLWFGLFAGVASGLGWVGWQRLTALATALFAVAAITGFRYSRRVGGITGDFLGATEQLGELAALAVLAWSVA